MHGRKKRTTPITQEERDEIKSQVVKASGLIDTLLDLRKNQIYDERAAEMTLKALQYNPEFSTLWNFRREILLSNEKFGLDRFTNELGFLEAALRKAPKAYCVWFHRRWVIEQLLATKPPSDLIKNELALCRQFFEYIQ